MSLTFWETCNLIYSYNKNKREPTISQIYFWNMTLHVSDSISVHHQESSTVAPRLTSDPANEFLGLTKIFSLFLTRLTNMNSDKECFSGCAR